MCPYYFSHSSPYLYTHTHMYTHTICTTHTQHTQHAQHIKHTIWAIHTTCIISRIYIHTLAGFAANVRSYVRKSLNLTEKSDQFTPRRIFTTTQ